MSEQDRVRSRSAYPFIIRTKASDMRSRLIRSPGGKWKRQKQYGSMKELDACGLSFVGLLMMLVFPFC